MLIALIFCTGFRFHYILGFKETIIPVPYLSFTHTRITKIWSERSECSTVKASYERFLVGLGACFPWPLESQPFQILLNNAQFITIETRP